MIQPQKNPIPFNEGDMEFLTGYLLGVGKLHLNPTCIPYAYVSISFYSYPSTLIFRSLDTRVLKHISYISNLPIEEDPTNRWSPAIIMTEKRWITFLLKEWIATLNAAQRIDPMYGAVDEFPELYDALKYVYFDTFTQ